ncbi:MAG: S-methyl-5'-thioadenosine phosphorylase [Streptosporangiales bacterium]|nr:S-methyl-5'-thioadenosine phosphorylase [Streptosporangiales bacterium]
MAEIGFIGGSGLYRLDGIAGARQVPVETPFGQAAPVVGEFGGREVAFVSRHGTGHRVPPAGIPARANVYALKSLGVRRLVGVSAVGSLRRSYEPGHLVVPDQIVDWTRGGRPASFFGEDLVVHVSLADPYCGELRDALVTAARDASGAPVHDGGTYICIEGPQFSTRAESELYRSFGMDVIGMTAMPEARLAREAELCYAGVALVTDYDCWHPGEDAVDADLVAGRMAENVRAAEQALAALIRKLPEEPGCACGEALAHAIITDRAAVPSVVAERLGLLVGRYLPQ